VALYPDLAPLTVNQFDERNLLRRSVIRYGTSKIWNGPTLMDASSSPFAGFAILYRRGCAAWLIDSAIDAVYS
jgi:hypothetical protein